MSDNRHKAALWYARRGWAVLPVWPIRDGRCACGQDCNSPGKHPVEFLTGDWKQSATAEAHRVNDWWGQVPDANIATVSWLRVDVDTKDNGKDHWGELERQYGRVDTVHCITPSGGDHYYFRPPEGIALGNGTGTLPAGIDVRGHGVGYTLLPPSNHEQGVYEWELSSRPDSMPVADTPDWLVEVLLDDTVALESVFFEGDLSRPDLSAWELSPVIEATILADRSRIDQAVITALIYAGATNDEIRAVFRHFDTTGKYAEKGRQRDKYLAHSIAKARAYVQRQQQQARQANGNGNGHNGNYTQAVRVYRQRRVRAS